MDNVRKEQLLEVYELPLPEISGFSSPEWRLLCGLKPLLKPIAILLTEILERLESIDGSGRS